MKKLFLVFLAAAASFLTLLAVRSRMAGDGSEDRPSKFPPQALQASSMTQDSRAPLQEPWDPGLRLLGTIVGEGMSSSALIQNIEGEKLAVYYVNSPVATRQGIGRVASISREGVLLRKDREEIFLRPWTAASGSPEGISQPVNGAGGPPPPKIIGPSQASGPPRAPGSMRLLHEEMKNEQHVKREGRRGGFGRWKHEREEEDRRSHPAEGP